TKSDIATGVEHRGAFEEIENAARIIESLYGVAISCIKAISTCIQSRMKSNDAMRIDGRPTGSRNETAKYSAGICNFGECVLLRSGRRSDKAERKDRSQRAEIFSHTARHDIDSFLQRDPALQHVQACAAGCDVEGALHRSLSYTSSSPGF